MGFGRCGALLPLFRHVGVRCIAALRRVKCLLRHRSDRPKLEKLCFTVFLSCLRWFKTLNSTLLVRSKMSCIAWWCSPFDSSQCRAAGAE
jgi:hypothetical protein